MACANVKIFLVEWWWWKKKLFTELLLLLTSKVATIAMESTHHEARMGGLGM
jgi:hypothetical protein